MKLIIASKINGLAEAIASQGYEIAANVDSTDELQRLFGSSESIANTLLVTEKINANGSLVNVLLDIHNHYPEVRIIFLATGDLTNRFTVNQLYMLASKGIYDLFYDGKITTAKTVELIKNPKNKYDCEEILNAYKEQTELAGPKAIITEVKKGVIEDTVRNNIVAVTSVKPGTGKSFVSSNLAATLARYGKKADGSKPRVLLLEGDLQTLSVTTLFGVKDNEYNLKTALRKIKNFLEKCNYDTDKWYEGAFDEKQFIKRCCLRTSYDNLFVLEGHNFDFNDIADCDGGAYFYLADYLASQYDIVVIDSNSSIQHPTTDPIFQIAKSLYFVYTTDFNNIKLNISKIDEYASMGVSDKVRYVLNKVLVGEQKENYKFEYTDQEIIGNKLRIDFKVPNIDMAVIFNSTYRHKQLAMYNDYTTIPVRIAFMKLAFDVMPLGNIGDLQEQVEMLKKEFKNQKNKK